MKAWLIGVIANLAQAVGFSLRVTQDGDVRVTQDGEQRVTED